MALGQDFDEQARCIEAYGQWPVAMFREVVGEWRDLAERLGLVDAGRLGPVANANVVRRVHARVPRGWSGLGVLKVSITGQSREPQMLQAYQRGCPGVVVPVVAHGVTARQRGWLLTEHVAGQEPGEPLAPDVVASAAERARALRAVFAEVDRPVGLVQAQASLVERVHACRGSWEALAHRVGGDAVAVRLMDVVEHLPDGDEVLHGDYRSRNVLVQPGGGFVVLDPSGHAGPAEADMATWIAIASAQAGVSPEEAIEVACAADPQLSSTGLTAWVAAHHLVLAADKEQGSTFVNTSAVDLMCCAIDALRRC